MGGLSVHFHRGGIAIAKDITGKLHDGHLHTEADAEKWNSLLAGILDGRYLTGNSPFSEAGSDKNSVGIFKKRGDIIIVDVLGMDASAKLREKGVIEVVPLAYMRGRTLDKAFIILDEAQNTTREQMKMFLTRMGFNSKVVVTGDITQIDLPSGTMSGLKEARKVLSGVEGIRFSYFTEVDVVRHELVKRIIKAYENYDNVNKAKAGNPKAGKVSSR